VTAVLLLVKREANVCTSYETNEYRKFEAFSIFSKPNFEFKREIYKDYPGAVVRRTDDGFQTLAATFGMVPRERIPPHVRPYDTMNARVETIGEKRSFSSAWKGLQLCLIPCEAFFEPNYETGKAVRWRIRLAGDQPTAIARPLARMGGAERGAVLLIYDADGQRRRPSVDVAVSQARCRKAVCCHHSPRCI
jgi:hypothetical protein